MSLRRETLHYFKTHLLERRSLIARDLQQATSEFLTEETTYTDTMDQASADSDRALAMQIKSRDRDILLEIDTALRRIDAGTFGECERCGDEISEARMRANPSTMLCIDCKAEIESEQRRIPSRAS